MANYGKEWWGERSCFDFVTGHTLHVSRTMSILSDKDKEVSLVGSKLFINILSALLIVVAIKSEFIAIILQFKQNFGVFYSGSLDGNNI